MGEPSDVGRFVRSSLQGLGAMVEDTGDRLVVDSGTVPIGLRDALHAQGTFEQRAGDPNRGRPRAGKSRGEPP
ncbi:MAG: hypothetical protein LBK59_03640 [Bifidobacteriaceae bacterium]|nr:hypothetical protein [Bifidobacteriaceae bacterium]